MKVYFKEGLDEAINPVRDALVASGAVQHDTFGGPVSSAGYRMVCADGRGLDVWIGTGGVCVDVDVTWYAPGADLDVDPSESVVKAQFPFGTPATTISQWFATELGVTI